MWKTVSVCNLSLLDGAGAVVKETVCLPPFFMAAPQNGSNFAPSALRQRCHGSRPLWEAFPPNGTLATERNNWFSYFECESDEKWVRWNRKKTDFLILISLDLSLNRSESAFLWNCLVSPVATAYKAAARDQVITVEIFFTITIILTSFMVILWYSHTYWLV